MKSRGRNYKRLNKKQKVQVDKTVKRMSKVRAKDSIRLRQNIKNKLAWAKEQQKKGLEAIEVWKKNIQKNSGELLKLQGIILVLTQLLEETESKKKE